MAPLNNIDVIILICVGISMFVAFVRGFVRETLSICGLCLFLIITLYLSPILLPFISDYIESIMLAQFVVFLIIMTVFYTIWIIYTDKVITKIRKSTLSFMDRLFGLIFGFLRAVFILGFCFLIVKLTLPEELKDKDSIFKKSQLFMLSEISSDFIEKLLPKDFIENSLKSVDSLNNVKKKDDDIKKNQTTQKDDVKQKNNLPSSSDQAEIDKMFDMLVNPQIKKTPSNKNDSEAKGYNNKDTNSLDRLIDITSEE